MEISHSKTKRRRFNESRIIRLPSNQELQPGMRRALQLRALLPLGTLRVSVHKNLSHMRTCTLASALISTVYVVIAYASSNMTKEEDESGTSRSLKEVCAVLACTQVALSIGYYKSGLRIRQLRGLVFEKTGLQQDSSFPWLLFEAVVLLLVVPPFLPNGSLPFEDLLLALSFLRTFVTYRLWFTLSHVLKQREMFYCDLYMLSRSRFVGRCMLEEKPLSFLLFITFAICGLAGLLLRVYERNETSIRSLYDSLWLISYTQRTIGYGDVIPQSHLGRLMCVGAGFIGCLTLSLMIDFVEQSTRLTVKEKNFLNELYSAKQAKRHLPSLAALLLQRWWRLVAARRKGRSRLRLVRLYASAAARFKLRFSLLMSKENPDVDETILRVQASLGTAFGICNAELHPLRQCGEKLANFSTNLSRFTVKLLEGRSQAKRLLGIPSLEKREPLRVNRFTWTARAAQVSKIAKKRYTDKAYKRVRGIVMSRDCSPISRSSLEVRESVSTSAQDV